MAVRYSGDLRISVNYDDRGHYRVSVGDKTDRTLWSARIRPAAVGFGRGVAYDSPEAYDEVATTALSFMADDLGSSLPAEYSSRGFQVRRVPRYWQQWPGGRVRPKKFAARDRNRLRRRKRA